MSKDAGRKRLELSKEYERKRDKTGSEWGSRLAISALKATGDLPSDAVGYDGDETPIRRAAQAFGLDPKNAEHRDRLLWYFCDAFFGQRRGGRAKGKTAGQHLIEAAHHEIKARYPEKTDTEIAALIKKLFPEKNFASAQSVRRRMYPGRSQSEK
jgi:hypothetical protein